LIINEHFYHTQVAIDTKKSQVTIEFQDRSRFVNKKMVNLTFKKIIDKEKQIAVNAALCEEVMR